MAADPLFRDRAQAGIQLASRLRPLISESDPLVLAIPRGGVPVGYEVAMTLQAELDVFVVRKLGVPGQEELAMGAIASGNLRVVNQEVIDELGLPNEAVDRIAATEQVELERRERVFREGRPAAEISGRTVILVDDGLATGASMLAALRAVRTAQPERLVIGVPIAPREACEFFKPIVDGIVCLHEPDPFHAVGIWYENFPQTSEAEVRRLLQAASHRAM